MKKIKAIVPTVCYTALLLVIALLSFLIVGEKGNTPSSAQNIRTEVELVLPEQKPLYDDVFPRESADGYQRIYGDGNIRLHDVLQTPIGNYVFLSSDCQKGDVASDRPTLALVKMNGKNDFVCSVSLGDEEYVAANSTARGIVVVSKFADSDKTVVRIVDYQLQKTTEYHISVSDSIHIVPTNDSFLLFAGYESSCIVYSLVEEELLFRTIDRSVLVDYFEYGDHYLVFCNLPSGGYCSLKLDKTTLFVSDKKIVGSGELIAIMPDGGNYVTVEKSSALVAKKYSAKDMTVEKECTLGDFSVLKKYRSEEGFLLYCDGPITGYVRVTKDLVSSFEEKALGSDAVILAEVYRDDRFLFLIKDADNNVSLLGEEAFDKAVGAAMISEPDGTITFFLQKVSDYGESYIDIYTAN